MTKIKTNFNDVTGATIVTGKGSQEKFAEGWEVIYGKKKRDIFKEIMEGFDIVFDNSVKTCIKCPRDVNKYCDYCGIRQCDGDEAEWSLNRIWLK